MAGPTGLLIQSDSNARKIAVRPPPLRFRAAELPGEKSGRPRVGETKKTEVWPEDVLRWGPKA